MRTKFGSAGIPSNQPMRGLRLARSSMPGWQKALAFVLGFCIELNIIIGGGGGGNFGLRITDLLSIVVVVFLGLHILARRSDIIVLMLFGLVVAAIISFRLFDPLFWIEPHTQILVGRYASYGFAALYIASLLNDTRAINLFCGGLITGLLATLPIFVLQHSDFSSTLVDLGLTSPLNQVFQNNDGTVRDAGLWGHPNEAGHVAALASAAGAYFVVVHRRFLPSVLVAVGLLITFYYTQSRGALLAGGATLVISLLFSWQRRLEIGRLLVVASAFVIGAVILSQLDSVASRFLDDPWIVSNYTERLNTTLVGAGLLLAYPFGVPIAEFQTIMTAETGIATPHNGFIYFAAIFGVLPLAILIAAFMVNLRIRETADVFFAFLTMQVGFSFLFEQLPASCSYTFFLCLILARAFLRTGIGRKLTSYASASGRPKNGALQLSG